ncbi:DUF3515 domain-containing protein [Nocardioides euryhalodurans]|uniref:DUF3515 domain-containing protein n=1 Tax=Nocardioides euryhalodurans TaxID=2518370 RepID=UPI001420E752|nr:DUF3515 domain-containing protein [Nocardioides euryhalodurans]
MLRRRPGTTRSRGVVLCVALTAAVAGCGTDPVAITGPDLDEADSRACRALVDDLPDALGDRERVEVTPADALGAAWGEPAIVLTCGVDEPGGITRTAVCQEVNGIGWFVPDAALEDESLDATLTAVGHRPRVQVSVPAEQRPEGVAAALAGVAGAVEEHTELVRPCL